MPGLDEFVVSHSGLIELATMLVALVGVYWRLVVRIERMEEREVEAQRDRKDMKDALLRIDAHKVDRYQCDSLHHGMEGVLNNLRAEVRELHAAVLEIATMIRKNGNN